MYHIPADEAQSSQQKPSCNLWDAGKNLNEAAHLDVPYQKLARLLVHQIGHVCMAFRVGRHVQLPNDGLRGRWPQLW